MISLGKKGLIKRNRGSYSCDFFSKKKGPRIETDGLIFLISLVKKRPSYRNRRSYSCDSLVYKKGAHLEIDGLLEQTFSV